MNDNSGAVQAGLVLVLVLATIFYAARTATIAAATKILAEETKESVQAAKLAHLESFRPRLFLDVRDGQSETTFSFTVKNTGNGSATNIVGAAKISNIGYVARPSYYSQAVDSAQSINFTHGTQQALDPQPLDNELVLEYQDEEGHRYRTSVVLIGAYNNVTPEGQSTVRCQ